MDTASGSKYPPAKPVALICEPLNAVGPVALTRPGFLRHLSVARFYHHSATVLAADLPAPDACCIHESAARPASPVKEGRIPSPDKSSCNRVVTLLDFGPIV